MSWLSLSGFPARLDAHALPPMLTYPKMTACHTMISLPTGAPLMPEGGSVCSRLKSLIKRRLADILSSENVRGVVAVC